MITVAAAGDSNDTITGSTGNETMIGGSGADILKSHAGTTLDSGSHFVLGDNGTINFTAGLPVSVSPLESTFDGADTITTGNGVDSVAGGGGNDSITTNAGNDTIDGGSGNDTINAGENNDFVTGGTGDDSITGGLGNDVLFGGFAIGTRADYDLNTADFTLPPQFTAMNALYPVAPYVPALNVTPTIVGGVSIDGELNDGKDTLTGDAGNDVLFGGSDSDSLDGGSDADYLDAGAGHDTSVAGGQGDDVIRGGAGNDALNGGEGIDQLYGDAGDDKLFGDAGTGNSQLGQRLFGGTGRDELFAFATTSSTGGDQLFGEDDGDFLYGNIAGETLVGGGGNDFIQGDKLSGAGYADNSSAATVGGNDTLYGDSGDDQLLGGGGNDTIWGGAGTDLIDPQAGNNIAYGGSGIDIFTVWTGALAGNDTIDGHRGNTVGDTTPDDNATDILSLNGTSGNDTILLSQHVTPAQPLTDKQVRFDFNGTERTLTMLDANGKPLIEQFQIAGLAGHDTIGFVTAGTQLPAGITNPVATGVSKALDLSALSSRSRDFVGVFEGNSGNDLLIGGAGRDQLDGGFGSDVLYGFAGNDRLWGDQGGGSANDFDVLFAGQGNDDLVGGTGRNALYGWSIAPEARLVPTPGAAFNAGNINGLISGGPTSTFGVYFNSDTGAILRGADALVAGVPQSGFVLETTGLNRMIGSEQTDSLFGGTAVDFLYGNGGIDTLFRANGTTLESLDGGLAGDDWKNYARESDQIWYVGGTNANDEINIDFVTEPGLLADHHLLTRLTNNNGNFSFAAQVKLDFNATDSDGQLIWDARDRLFELDRLLTAQASGNASEISGLLGQIAVAQTNLITGLLPPEGDFQVILIDALDGNDTIKVGPTVQKSVWVDAGDGDDVVKIQPGKSILSDKAENSQPAGRTRSRNDAAIQAFELTKVVGSATGTFDGQTLPAGASAGALFTGLTMDSAADQDWFTFTLASVPNASSKFELASASVIDSLGLTLFNINADGTAGSQIRTSTATGDIGSISLTGLTASTRYLLRINSPKEVPTIYDLRLNLSGTAVPAELSNMPTIDLAVTNSNERRDLILVVKAMTFSRADLVKTSSSVRMATMF